MIGPTLKFNTVGVLDLSLMYYKEKNHTGIPGAQESNHTFDDTYMLNLTWMRPFEIGNHAAKFQGFINYVGERRGLPWPRYRSGSADAYSADGGGATG